MGGVAVTPVPPPKPTFGGANEAYLKSLTESGVVANSNATLSTMAATGMPTDVGPQFDALKASMAHGIDEGRANLIEKFGVQGLRYGSDMDKAGADFETQTQTNFASILQQMITQSSEAAKERQLKASTIGQQAGETAGLAVSPTVVAGGPTTGQVVAGLAVKAAATAAMFA